MKKEKSVRKAEFQAALFRQLKSLIVPFIILAIILIGVLVISFSQGEAEPEEEEIFEIDAAESEDLTDEPEDLSEVEELISETEVVNDEDDSEGAAVRKTMDNKNNEEPILSPEIQKLIDEIEGVIPEEEEVDATVSSEEVLEVEEEPHENMGELADDLRLGEDEYEDYDAYDWDDAAAVSYTHLTLPTKA